MTAREVIGERWLADRLPARDDRAHKGNFGRVLVVAGSLEFPGAAVLAGVGALRGGAGVVRVATARSVAERMAAALPELTWAPLDEEAPGLVAPGGWRAAAAEAEAHDAVVLGPGLGRVTGTQRRVRAFLSSIRRPTVVDADALNALSSDAEWPRHAGVSLVLTPHAGEFARLVGEAAPEPDDDDGRETAAAAAAARWGHVVVLKGARTVVAAPDGRLLVSPASTPALATGGSGDVLSGVIGALLAARLATFEAAACGVGLHAAAGVLAEERIGRSGSMASDIATLIPQARRLITGEGE